MTIWIGTVEAPDQMGNAWLKPPMGFNGAGGIRITNGCSVVLEIVSPSGIGASRELIFPSQQMIYRTQNIQNKITANMLPEFLASTAVETPVTDLNFYLGLFAEWSDDPVTDFPGTYPVDGIDNPYYDALNSGALQPFNGAVVTTGQTIVPANPLRRSITIESLSTNTDIIKVSALATMSVFITLEIGNQVTTPYVGEIYLEAASGSQTVNIIQS